MQLRLGFEAETSVMRATGEAVIDLTVSAVNSQAVITVRSVEIASSNVVLDLGSRVLAQPLRDILAKQISQALNETIADLPKQISALKKVELLDLRD